jgi:hypothetical protein
MSKDLKAIRKQHVTLKRTLRAGGQRVTGSQGGQGKGGGQCWFGVFCFVLFEGGRGCQ